MMAVMDTLCRQMDNGILNLNSGCTKAVLCDFFF